MGSLVHASNAPGASGNGGNREGANTMSENTTDIQLIVGETVIPAVLNDSKPARALLAKLPYTVRLQRYEHDFCGVMDDALPYDKTSLRSGWKNGDIAYAVDGNYFAILYKDEEISQQFDGMVTMGGLDCPPSVMESLDRSISVRIEPRK
jgi:hypothetical protein